MGSKDGLWEFFNTAVFWKDDRLLRPALVFDQFDVIFTLQSPAGRKAISQQISELVGGGLPHRIREMLQEQRQEQTQKVGYSEKPPVINVSWQDARDYAAWLSKRTGKWFCMAGEQCG